MIAVSQPAVTLAAVAVEVWVYGGIAAAVVIAIAVVVVQYKRCPSNRILVVYGRVGKDQSCKCLHGGGAFVVPLVQDYAYLSLEPMTIEVERLRFRSKDRVKLEFDGSFAVAISTAPALIRTAAERLLNMPQQEIREQVQDIILGQVKLVIGSLTADEIDDEEEKLIRLLAESVGEEVQKLGLYLININIRFVERLPT